MCVMSAKVRARIAAQGWVTRVSKRLETLIKDSVDITELQDAAVDFDNRIGKVDEI